MPRTLPTQALHFIASIAVIVLLAAAAPQKPAAPLPSSQAQLEARVKELETRLAAAEQKADKATMEKDYILRTQNHYEAYYKEVFSTQTHILWTIGVTVTLIALTFSVVFFVAGRFGFNIFDRKIDSALKDATTQLRTEFAERLANETSALQEAHAAELKTLGADLTERINQQIQDLKTLSTFQHNFAQALTLAADKRHADARIMYRAAVKAYKFGKPRQVITKRAGVAATRNLFLQFANEDEANSVQNAKKELAGEFYNDLEDELALAAVRLDWLLPLVAERKQTKRPPIAKEAKTEE
jgi:hypothetical protein